MFRELLTKRLTVGKNVDSTKLILLSIKMYYKYKNRYRWRNIGLDKVIRG